MKRRSFVIATIVGIKGLITALLGLPAAIYFFLDPRNRPAGSGDFKRVANLADLPDGVPAQAIVRDVRSDAWTLYPNDVVGRVWLIKDAPDRVRAYTTICPHLGCSINYSGASSQFVCPCHKGTWDLAGAKVSGPVPRAMDELECRVVTDESDGGAATVEVRYEVFRQGEPTKKVKT
jgi:Rieske Fe-S protein